MFKYFGLIFSLLFLSSCLQKPTELVFEEKALDGKVGSNNSLLQGSAAFKVAYGKMETQGCFSCHGAGYPYGDLKNLFNEKDWVDKGLISPSQPDDSFLIKKLKNSNSNIASMPSSGRMSDTDYGLIRSWILAYKINSAPNLAAGTTSTVILPSAGLTLLASATDADGTISSYQWIKESGPAVSLSGEKTNSLNLTNLNLGTYVFKVTVKDDLGAEASTTFRVLVNPPNNIAPTVNGGVDQSITLPTQTATLNAVASDSDGTIASYKWVKSSGPVVNISGDTTKTLQLSGLIEGTYTFTIEVKDDKGAVAQDSVTVVVNPEVITDPFKKAYKTMELNGCFGCHKAGYGNGDLVKNINEVDWINAGLVVAGKPNESLLVKKLKLFNASISTMPPSGNISQVEYDNIRNWIAAIKVVVPPVVNAGSDITITLPTNTANFTAVASTETGSITRYSWVKTAGPDNAVLSGIATSALKLSSLVEGTYTFTVTVENTAGGVSSDSVQLIVNPANNTAPTVNAGADTSITLPTNSISLTATALDTDGTIASYQWVKTSGPSATLSGATTKTLTASALVSGSYVFTVTVKDNKGAVAEDSITVVVNPEVFTDPFKKAYNVMEVNGCFGCHTAGYTYGDYKKLLVEKDWVTAGLVVAGKPDDSLLIKKLKNSGSSIATMPSGSTMSDADYNSIRTWISQIVAAPVVVNPPSSDPGAVGQYKINTQIIGIEQFLDQLKKIYFISSSDNTVFYGVSNNWRAFWGGGCDMYRGSAINKLKNSYMLFWENPTSVCDYPKTNIGPQGILSIIQAGSRVNICEYFADSDEYMDEFFAKKFITGTSFNKANAEKVFALYYPTFVFTDAIYNNFVNTSVAQHSAITGNDRLYWRLYLSTLCQSLAWETL